MKGWKKSSTQATFNIEKKEGAIALQDFKINFIYTRLYINMNISTNVIININI